MRQNTIQKTIQNAYIYTHRRSDRPYTKHAIDAYRFVG